MLVSELFEESRGPDKNREFGFQDKGNAAKAKRALLAANIEFTTSSTGGIYYFHFPTAKVGKEALKIVKPLVDKSKESKWSGSIKEADEDPYKGLTPAEKRYFVKNERLNKEHAAHLLNVPSSKVGDAIYGGSDYKKFREVSESEKPLKSSSRYGEDDQHWSYDLFQKDHTLFVRCDYSDGGGGDDPSFYVAKKGLTEAYWFI